MKKAIIIITSSLVLLGCKPAVQKEDKLQSQLIGSWKLISSVAIRKDSIIRNDNPGTSMIKILNETHFAFLSHDVSVMADSVKNKDNHFGGGGGSYTLTGNHYVENLEYCSAAAYEGNKFEFNVEIKGDSLIQTGEEKLKDIGAGDENQLLVEKYIRISK